MEDNEDDIFLANDLTDSNSGAAKSVISFIQWLTSSQSPWPDFDYLIVADDTSYVGVDKVLSRLHKSLTESTSSGKDSTH